MVIEPKSKDALLLAEALAQYANFLNVQIHEKIGRLSFNNDYVGVEEAVSIHNERIIEINLLKNKLVGKKDSEIMNLDCIEFNSDDIPF